MVAFNKDRDGKEKRDFFIRGFELAEEDGELVLYVDEIHPANDIVINFVIMNPNEDKDEDFKPENN